SVTGGLYRSSHADHEDGVPEATYVRPSDRDEPDDPGTVYPAASHFGPDGDYRPSPEDSGVIPADGPTPGVVAAEEALPPEEPGPGPTRQSAIMAVWSFVSRIIGFVRNALVGMTLGSAVGDAYTSAQFLPN